MGVRQWRRWARMRGWLVVCGLAVAASGSAAEPPVPAAWLAYAAAASDALGQRLAQADDARVARLHAFLQQTPQTAGAGPLAVRLWIDPVGTVTRSEFASLGDTQADADLHALLEQASLPAAPPPGMRQPLRLGLSLQPLPPDTP